MWWKVTQKKWKNWRWSYRIWMWIVPVELKSLILEMRAEFKNSSSSADVHRKVSKEIPFYLLPLLLLSSWMGSQIIQKNLFGKIKISLNSLWFWALERTTGSSLGLNSLYSVKKIYMNGCIRLNSWWSFIQLNRKTKKLDWLHYIWRKGLYNGTVGLMIIMEHLFLGRSLILSYYQWMIDPLP